MLLVSSLEVDNVGAVEDNSVSNGLVMYVDDKACEVLLPKMSNVVVGSDSLLHCLGGE